MTLFKPNRKYPTIPTITGDLDSHTRALQALAECVQIHERRTKDINSSFVRVDELVEMGLITITNDGGFNRITIDLDDIDDIDDVSGAADGDLLRYDADDDVWTNMPPSSLYHGDLGGLEGDHHTQYLLVNGVRAMTGDLLMGANDVRQINIASFGEIADPGFTAVDTAELHAQDDAGITRLYYHNDHMKWVVNQDNYVVARNSTGSTIDKMRAVRVVGGSGNRPTIGLGDAATGLRAGGVTAASVANNAYVEVLTVGVLTGVDTSAWAEGTALYLGASGVLQSTIPAWPGAAQQMAVVLDQHAVNGSIYVTRQSDARAAFLAGEGVQIFDGTPAAPGVAFLSDTDTGIYRPGANQVGITAGAKAIGIFNNSGGTQGELRLVSPNVADVGGTTVRFLRDDNTTTMGFVGYAATADDDLDIINSVGMVRLQTSGANPIQADAPAGFRIGNQTTALITNVANPAIYAADGGGTGDFGLAGTLFIQPRSSATRDIVFLTGTTSPLERLRLTGAGAAQISTGGALAVDINTSQRMAVGRAVGSLGARITSSDAAGGGSFLSEDTAVADASRPFAFMRANGGNMEFGNANRSGTGTTGSTVRAIIAAGGQMIVGGTTTSVTVGGQTGELQISGSSPAQTINRFSNDGSGAIFVFTKSRHTTIGSSTVVQSGDQIGEIFFAAADGTDLASVAASIRCNIDGTPGTDDVPGSLLFRTTADGAASPTTRTSLMADGSLRHAYALDLSGVISPAQLTATTNDWAPTGLADVIVIRFSTDASRDITGLTGGRAGRVAILINVGTTNAGVLKNDNAGSTAANRFLLASGTDSTIQPGGAAIAWYDTTSSRWRHISRLA